MKKFLLVLTTLALVGVGAFAADVGGEVYGGVYLLQGDSSKDSDVTAAGAMTRLRLNLSGQNGDGTLGGAMRLNIDGLGFDKSGIITDSTKPGKFTTDGYAWWRPNSIVMVGVGHKPGDWFGGRQGAFNSMLGGASDVLVADNGNDSGSARLGDGKIGTKNVVTGGWDKWGAGMELTPIKGLHVNVGIPYIDSNGNTISGGNKDNDDHVIGQLVDKSTTNMGITSATRATDMYSNIFYQAVCDLDVINGWVALTYSPDKWTPSADLVDRGQIYATVDSKIVPNLELTASFGYRLPGKVNTANIGPGSYGDDGTGSPNDVANLASDVKNDETTNHPVAVGLAGVYKNGDIGVNFRTVALFGGKQWSNKRVEGVVPNDDESDAVASYYYNSGAANPFRIMADLVPNYDVTDNMTAYLALGITSIGETKTEGNEKNIPGAFGWSVNPYVSYKIGGRVSLYGGVRVQSNGGFDSKGNNVWKEGNMDKGRDPIIQWAIPIGMSASF